jgi:Zn-dependent protease
MDFLFSIGVFIPILLLSVTIHEVAHGYVAYRLGDPTAKNAGRLTLNPLVHIDPTGLIVMIITSLMGFPFGWAKPVPVDTRYFKDQRKGMMITGAAGPLSNIAIILIFNIIWRLVTALEVELPGRLDEMLAWIIYINLILASLNLIPIPPLDGSRIVAGLLPPKQRYIYASIERYGFIILIILVFTRLLRVIMYPIMYAISFILWVDWYSLVLILNKTFTG